MSTPISLSSEIVVEPIQHMGGDAFVVAAARVSTSGPEARNAIDTDPAAARGLIHYLMKHRHGSPFEHAALTFFTRAPIFVYREWHRHRIASYNEESARYRKLEPRFWVPRRQRRLCPAPGSSSARPRFQTLDEVAPDRDNDSLYDRLIASMRSAYQTTYDIYEWLLSEGVAREVARAVLPVGIYSSCWVTLNPRALMHFLSLRTHEPTAMFVSHPQAEIEEAARAIEGVFAEFWPLTYEAFNAYGRVAP